MEDDKGYLYRKNKMYNGFLYLYCVNKFNKTYKCPAHVKALPNKELEFITHHNSSCMMERLRKSRGIVQKKPKKSIVKHQRKAPPIPIRVPTKKFNKITVEEYFETSTQNLKSDGDAEEKEEDMEIKNELTENQDEPDRTKIRNEIEDVFKRIEAKKKQKANKNLEKFMIKK
jgi:hypothetical protein